MAKRLVHHYTFVPAEKKIICDGLHNLERFLLITNVTDNQTLFTFNDAVNGITAHSLDRDAETTSVTLAYDTTSMSSTDKLQIFVEGDDVLFRPEEALVDPVHKMRVSNPENLIDTDFEYGLQSSKWETIELSNNVPSFYGKNSEYSLGNISIVRSTAGSDIIRVTTTDPHNLTKGTPIDVQGLTSLTAEGKYLVQAVESTLIFTYKSRSVQAETKNLKTPYTTIVPGQFYTGADVNFVSTSGIQTDGANQSTLSMSTPYAHGFSTGSKFYLLNTVSPKTLLVDKVGSTNAPDGLPYVDTTNQETANITPDLTRTNTKALKGAYSLRFGASAVDATANTITWNGHGFRENDCLMYIKPAGPDSAIGGLESLEIYYVTVPTTNTFRLKLTSGGAPIDFTTAGTYAYGQAELTLVYEFYYLFKQYASYSNYWYTWNAGTGDSNSSGWDLQQTTYGKMGRIPDYWIPYHRSKTGGNYANFNEYPYYSFQYTTGGWWGASYSGNHTRDNHTTYPHSFNFWEDFTRYDQATNFDAPASSQNYNHTSYGFRWDQNYYSGYWAGTNYTYFNRGDMFWVPAMVDSEADSFYSAGHGLTTGQNITFGTSGSPLYYYSHSYGGNFTSTYTPSTLTAGTYTVEVVNDNRFRLKSGSTTIRISAAAGTYTFSALRNRKTANTFYLQAHGLSENNLLTAGVDQGGRLPATTSGPIAYASTDGDLEVFYGIIYNAVDQFQAVQSSRANLVFDGPQKEVPFLYGSGNASNTTMNQGFSHTWNFYDSSWSSWNFAVALNNNWDTGEAEDAGVGTPVSGLGNSLVMTPYVKDASIPLHLAVAKNPLNRNGYSFYYPRWNVTQTYDLLQRNTNTTNPTVWTTVGVNGASAGVVTDWRFARAVHYANATGRDSIVHVQYVISKDSWDSFSFVAQNINHQTSGNRFLYFSNNGENQISASVMFRVPDAINMDSTFFNNLDAYIMDGLYASYSYPTLTLGTNYKARVVDDNRISLKTISGVPVDITSVGISGPAGDTSYTVTNSGLSAYVIDGENNPTLYLKKGYTYTFSVTAGGHPFWLQKVSGAYNAGELLGAGDGVTNNGAENGSIIYVVPSNAPATIYYVCQNHQAMGGTVVINTESAAITFLDVTNQIGNLDGVFTVSEVPNSTSLKMLTNFKAGTKLINIVKATQTDNDFFKFGSDHNLADGTPVIYGNGGNASYSGFISGSTYYATVVDNVFIRLSDTLADKNNGIYKAIDWSTIPASTHTLTSSTVNGLVRVPGTVSVTLGSNVITGAETSQFLTYFKAGDDLVIKNAATSPGKLETFKISSVVDDAEITLASPCSFTDSAAILMTPTKVYTRPDGATTHRPFDGGVEIIAGTAPKSQIVRQTRKYFRYQSGKGIQISLAINFNPPTLAQSIQAVTDVKCERDIGYIVDGARLDLALGTTYWAYFNGLAEINSKYLNDAVNARITKAKNDMIALAGVAASATAVARITAHITEILDIIDNGRNAANVPTFTNPTNATSNVIAAKDKILANIDFITAEINAFVAVNYPNADHDVSKCTRDIKYALYSFAHDILYGGNAATWHNGRFFNYALGSGDGTTTGIYSTHKQQTIDAYNHLASIIDNIVEGVAITPSAGNTQTQVTSGANATSAESTILQNLAQIIEDVVTYGVGTPGLGTYTKTEPSITWAASDLQTAANAINTNKSSLIPSYAARITTRYPHNISGGQMIKVTDCKTAIYNGDHMVTVIVDSFTFQYSLGDTPSDFNPAGVVTWRPTNWSNSNLRAGMFDFQNGFFFEYDGQQIYAVRRNSTTQISGTAAVTFASNLVTGTNTSFTRQLVPGDLIVIRGQSYKVTAITSNTDLVIQPKYRGNTAEGVVITQTIDTKIPQSQWNIDICDGKGPSNFLLDTTKIQMAYMDYSWYGAGKIRFGFKDTYGHVIYCHEFVHNNRETEAYMRSGNLPARYEIENIGTASYIPRLFHWGTSVIMDGTFDDDKAYLFTAKSDTLSFTNGQTLTSTTNSGSTLVGNYNWATRVRDWYVYLYFPTSDASKFSVGTPLYTSTNSLKGEKVDSTFFQGSSVIVRIFIASQNNQPTIYPVVGNGVTVNIGAPASGGSVGELLENIPLISIRLAPSVDNGITGNVGERDVINRMQLQLKQIGLVLTHDCEVSLVLNSSLSNINFRKVQAPSLSNLVVHAKGDSITGGTPIFSFRASGGTQAGNTRLSAATDFDLTDITDLGNSILGGDGVFPNGPDLLTIAVKVIDTSTITATSPFVASGRITWSESQA